MDRGRQNLRDRGRGSRDVEARPAEPVDLLSDPRLQAIDVSFLPERHGLAPLAHRLSRSFRAYSLFEVASLFLSKPEFYAVKLEVRPGPAPAFDLIQCAECKALFLDKEAAAGHAFARHFDRFCHKEEKDVEPPKGNFVCVARCGLSGVLLGPPNYHGYNDRVAELHHTRYASMSIDAYRNKIETVHDAALIEKWKEEMKRQVTYRCGEGETAVTFERFVEAEAWFREHGMESILRTGRHFVLPGTVVHGLEDMRLRRLIEDAWQREDHFPLRLSIALRLAFRHLGMHTFKTGGGQTFLTAVAPNAMDPTHAVPVVRTLLDFITAKPGCTRQEMQDSLAVAPAAGGESAAVPAPEAAVPPGVPAPVEPAAAEGGAPIIAAAPTVEAAEINTQLRWLVEKGHVIEFSDGRLAVPSATVSRVQMAYPHGPPRRDQRKERAKP